MTQRPFRGKRIDNGEWVVGHYLTRRTNEYGLQHIISVQDMWGFHEVDPETVGQSLVIPDRNGVQIFVGDICRDSLGWVFEVRWDVECSRYIGVHSKPRGDTYICYVNIVDKHDRSAVEVIGNIYESPELLTA